MLFTWNITVQAGTPDTSPKVEKLDLLIGLIKEIRIRFLAGCHGTVKVRLINSGAVIMPSGTNQYVIGDDEEITADMNYALVAGSQFLNFEASSPNATYDHTIAIRINILTTIDTEDIVKLLKQITTALDVGIEKQQPEEPEAGVI